MNKKFEIPKKIIQCGLTKAELIVLVVLYFLREDNDLTRKGKEDGWFFATDEEIVKYAPLNLKSVRMSKPKLELKGLIKYRCGTRETKNRSEHLLLVD